MTRIFLAIALLAVSGLVRAQDCGDTITGDVTLSADLHCDTGWTALYVPTSGVTINLNGHTLSGTTDLSGIDIVGADSVRVVNGTISGFWSGVNGVRAHGAAIQGVTFRDIGSGVSLNLSKKVEITDSDFLDVDGTAIQLSIPAGFPEGPGGFHAIGYNTFKNIGSGIGLCGYLNGSSKIVGNEIVNIRDYGIHLADGSGNNLIHNNRIEGIDNTGIVLDGSRDNRITSNLISHVRLGVAMNPQFGGACDTGPLTAAYVRDNQVGGNSLFKLDGGMTLGFGSSKKPLVFKNHINNNKFYYSETGLFFQTDAQHNDATGNGYADTTYPVIDEGYGNSY